jgi:2,4-dienoyl-CoA reductase-like NADH-dependent reductase (Old Yellow Enzyme family)
MSALFTPLTLRSVTLANRIGVSPMCQYSSEDGYANDWHLVHLGGLATGGAALVFTEATAVTADGRISPQDLGIWKDDHLPMLQRIVSFMRAHGTVPGIQLAHAGRKASTKRPWEGSGAVAPENGGWTVRGPSDVAFSPDYPAPHALALSELPAIVDAFVAATKRAHTAGFQVVELHASHGYLLHAFMSPLSNTRTDAYGGSYENRVRLTLEVAEAVRAAWPEELPMFVRLSVTDWAEGGWSVDESVRLSAQLKALGVDVIDCSSGGLTTAQRITIGAGYQVPFARRVKHEADIMTAAVGLITTPQQAEAIIADGDADVVLMARAFLRNPRWPLQAAQELGAEVRWMDQYARGKRA